MRTKTLLIAATALAVGIVSSQAQVYSQNIVGYANVKINGGQYNMLSVPFSAGVSNGANEVFNGNYALNPGYLPDGTILYKWNGTSFDGNMYDVSAGADANNWYNGDESATADTPVLVPGQGFFLVPPAGTTFTNLYAGTVAVNVGAQNVMTVIGGHYNMVGCVIPAEGAVSNAVINMYPPDGTILYRWNGISFDGNMYDVSAGADANNWYNGDESATANTPVITVGQGFFVVPPSTWLWTNSLPAN
jgi:hypothetical protein